MVHKLFAAGNLSRIALGARPLRLPCRPRMRRLPPLLLRPLQSLRIFLPLRRGRIVEALAERNQGVTTRLPPPRPAFLQLPAVGRALTDGPLRAFGARVSAPRRIDLHLEHSNLRNRPSARISAALDNSPATATSTQKNASLRPDMRSASHAHAHLYSGLDWVRKHRGSPQCCRRKARRHGGGP
jgi:hypothetical protein